MIVSRLSRGFQKPELWLRETQKLAPRAPRVQSRHWHKNIVSPMESSRTSTLEWHSNSSFLGAHSHGTQWPMQCRNSLAKEHRPCNSGNTRTSRALQLKTRGHPMFKSRNHKNIQCTLAKTRLTFCEAATVWECRMSMEWLPEASKFGCHKHWIIIWSNQHLIN